MIQDFYGDGKRIESLPTPECISLAPDERQRTVRYTELVMRMLQRELEFFACPVTGFETLA
jgi:hypothetical protein